MSILVITNTSKCTKSFFLPEYWMVPYVSVDVTKEDMTVTMARYQFFFFIKKLKQTFALA